MASVAPPNAAAEVQFAARQTTQDPGPAAQAAERRVEEHAAAQRADLTPDKVHVQLDTSAGRFVQTLTDAQTAEMLRRYPSESQLAYARAVMAYLRAMSGG